MGNLEPIDQLISIIVGALTVIGFVISWIKGWLPKFFNWILGFFGLAITKKNPLPKKTLIVQEFHALGNSNFMWWHMGKRKDSPMMQVSGRLKVTNISNYNITILGAYLKKAKAKGSVEVPDQNSQYWGQYPVEEGVVTEISFSFYIQPPFREEKENFSSDVAIMDNFGNKHWIRNLKFEYR